MAVKWIIAGVLFAAAAAPSVYFYDQYQTIKGQMKAQGKPPAETAKELETLVGKHMTLPKETPSIARVSDSNALSGQEFFTKAQNGDKVLIYKKAKLAILYRPSSDKIVNVAPISLTGEVAGENTASKAATPQQAQQAALAVYNGTNRGGVAKQVSEKVKTANPGIEIVKLADARNNYPKTVVIAFNSSVNKLASTLAKELGGEVGSLPKGEASPAADMLIIAGE